MLIGYGSNLSMNQNHFDHGASDGKDSQYQQMDRMLLQCLHKCVDIFVVQVQ